MTRLSAAFVALMCCRLVLATASGDHVYIDDEDGDSPYYGSGDEEGSGDFESDRKVVGVSKGPTTGHVDVSVLMARVQKLDERVAELETKVNEQSGTIEELNQHIEFQNGTILKLESNCARLDTVIDSVRDNRYYIGDLQKADALQTQKMKETLNYHKFILGKILDLQVKYISVFDKLKNTANITGSVVEKLARMDDINVTVNKKLLALEMKSKAGEKKLDRNDQLMTRTTLVFLNVPEEENKSYVETLKTVVFGILNQVMRLSVGLEDVVDVHRDDSEDLLRCLDVEDEDNYLLRRRSKIYPRPVVIRFASYLTKLRVLEARATLKSTSFKVLGVYSEFINQRRKALKPFLQEKRRLGHRVQLVDDKLELDDGKMMTLKELRAEKNKIP